MLGCSHDFHEPEILLMWLQNNQSNISFEDLAPNSVVRTTKINCVNYLSVRDIIMAVCGQNQDRAGHTWRAVSDEMKEELAETLTTYKFVGQGQKAQPVITLDGAMMVVTILPGQQAKGFRLKATKLLIRFAAGDRSLIREIEANAESQAPISRLARESLGKRGGSELEAVDSSSKSQRQLSMDTGMQEQLAVALTQSNAGMSAIAEEMASFNGSQKTLSDSNAKLTKELASLGGSNAKLTKELASLTETNAKLTETNSKLNKTNGSLTKEVADFNTRSQNMECTRRNLEKKNDSQSVIIARLNGIIAKLTAENDHLKKSAINELSTRFTKVEAALSTMPADIRALKGGLEPIKKHVEKAETKLKGINTIKEDYLRCPICTGVMQEPYMIFSSSVTYCLGCISHHIELGGMSDPVVNLPMARGRDGSVIGASNQLIKRMISDLISNDGVELDV